VVVHVVAVGDLLGTPVAAAVDADDAVPLVQEEHHLRVPVVGGQRPAVAEDDRLSRSPVLVVDLRAVIRGDEWHAPPPSRAPPDPARTLDMYLASDVDTDPTRREGTNFCGGRLTSRGKGTYRGRPRGLRGGGPGTGIHLTGCGWPCPPRGLMRGDGIPWLAARRSGCPRSGVRVLTSADPYVAPSRGQHASSLSHI